MIAAPIATSPHLGLVRSVAKLLEVLVQREAQLAKRPVEFQRSCPSRENSASLPSVTTLHWEIAGEISPPSTFGQVHANSKGHALDDLPTPIALARMRLSASQSLSSQDIFMAASLVAEAMLKWCTTTAISLLAADDASRAIRLGREVASASGIGTWESDPRSSDWPRPVPDARGANRIRTRHHKPERKREVEHAEASIVRAAIEIRQVIEMLGERTFHSGRSPSAQSSRCLLRYRLHPESDTRSRCPPAGVL